MTDYTLARAIGLEVDRINLLTAIKKVPLPYSKIAETAGLPYEVALAHLDFMEEAGLVRSYLPEHSEHDGNGIVYRHFKIVPSGLARELQKAKEILSTIEQI